MCENNYTYRKALSTYREQSKAAEIAQNYHPRYQHIKESAYNKIDTRFVKKSYRDILLTETQRNIHDLKVDTPQIGAENTGDQSEEESTESIILGNSLGKLKKKKRNKKKKTSNRSYNVTQDDGEVLSVTHENSGNKDKAAERKIGLKKLLHKLKEIIKSDCNFDVKVKLVFNFIFEKCFQYIWKLVKETDVISRIFSTLYGLFA